MHERFVYVPKEACIRTMTREIDMWTEKCPKPAAASQDIPSPADIAKRFTFTSCYSGEYNSHECVNDEICTAKLDLVSAVADVGFCRKAGG